MSEKSEIGSVSEFTNEWQREKQHREMMRIHEEKAMSEADKRWYRDREHWKNLQEIHKATITGNKVHIATNAVLAICAVVGLLLSLRRK